MDPMFSIARIIWGIMLDVLTLMCDVILIRIYVIYDLRDTLVNWLTQIYFNVQIYTFLVDFYI